MRVSAAVLFLLLAFAQISFAMEPRAAGASAAPLANGGAIYGQITIPGKALDDVGLIYLFDAALGPPPSRDKYWRVPDYIDTLGDDGSFLVETPPGTYYLIATKRKKHEEVGPPNDGDYFYFNGDDKGNPLPLIIAKGTRFDIGKITGEYTYSRKALFRDSGITTVEGIVLDSEGNPLQAALVFASLKPANQGRPLFVSERTGKDGKFLLRVHDSGVFYLRVRGLYGAGKPEDGELVSEVGGEKPTMVSLKRDEKLKGIVLKVKPLPKRGQGGSRKQP